MLRCGTPKRLFTTVANTNFTNQDIVNRKLMIEIGEL